MNTQPNHKLTVSNESAFILAACLMHCDSLPTTQDKFKAGNLLEKHYEAFERPQAPTLEWMAQEYGTLELSEGEREVCKKVITWGSMNGRFNASKYLNQLLTQLGLAE